jgi:RHS repeat-associated protein
MGSFSWPPSQGSGYTLNAAIDSMGDRLATSATAGFAWIVPDLHGNVAAQCGSTGTITDVFRYDPYGKIIGTSITGSVPSPWRFGGRILESTTGSDTYDFGARAYVPDLGTFTSLDSVTGSAQNPLTLNRYLYALGNPATLVDPDGHCAYIDNYSGCEGLAADDWIKSAPTRKAATAKHHAQVQMAAILSSGMGGSTPTAATPQATQAAAGQKKGCDWNPFSGDSCVWKASEGALFVAGGVVEGAEQFLDDARHFTADNLTSAYKKMGEWGPDDIGKTVADDTAGLGRAGKYVGPIGLAIQGYGVVQKLVTKGPAAAFEELLIDGASDGVAFAVGGLCELATGPETFGLSTVGCIAASVVAGMETDASLHLIIDHPDGGF